MSRQLFEEARKVLTQEAAAKLDPVGQEDKDIDNDGDSDNTDSYLKRRRGAISAAIKKSKNESSLSDDDVERLKSILGEQGVAEGSDKLQGTPVVSLSDFDGKDNKKNKYGQTVPRRLKKDDPRVKFHKDEKKDVAEGSLEEVSLGLAKRARDKAEYFVDMDYDDMRDRPYGYSEKQRSKFQRYIDRKEPRAKGDRDWDPPKKKGVAEARSDDPDYDEDLKRFKKGLPPKAPKKIYTKDFGKPNTPKPAPEPAKNMKKEEVEQVIDEQGRVVKGKGYDNPENVRKAPEGDTKMSSMMPGYDERAARFLARQATGRVIKGKAQSAPQKEDFEMIENLSFNISGNPPYQDYIKAALTIAECNSLQELSEEDQEYIISEMEDAYRTNDIDFIVEANAIADMKKSIASLKDQGYAVEGFYEDDHLFYVYEHKDTGVIRKVFYEGTQKVTQVLENLGQDVSDFSDRLNAYMKKKYGKDAPTLKPRTSQSVIKPVAPHDSPEAALAQLNRNIPLPRKI